MWPCCHCPIHNYILNTKAQVFLWSPKHLTSERFVVEGLSTHFLSQAFSNCNNYISKSSSKIISLEKSSKYPFLMVWQFDILDTVNMPLSIQMLKLEM